MSIVLGSLCTGYGGLDMGALAAFGGGRIAWVADPDPHVRTLLAARLPDVPNLGDIREVDWTTVARVDVITAGFPCLNVKLDLGGCSPERSAGFVDDVEQWCGRGLGWDVLEQVPAGVAVGPVEPPAGAVVSQLGYGSAGPLGSEVLAPGGASLEDRHVRAAHGVLDADLVAGVLGDVLGAPAGDLAQVGVRDRHAGDRHTQPRAPRRVHRARRVVGHDRHGRELAIGSLFTGYGGLDIGVRAALGRGRIVWVADPDRHVRVVLDRLLPDVPNLGDVTAIDWGAVARVDVLTAGWPCQDISAAGKRAGIDKGARSGLWREVVTAIRWLRPRLVVAENVAALRWRGGLDRVLGDLAGVGYDCVWTSLRACDVGAAHRRERVFLLAFPAAELAEAAALVAYSLRRYLRSVAAAAGAPVGATGRIEWGVYEPAIRRWEGVLGRVAPHPTEPGRGGRPVLAPRFVEWLMGVEPGVVTDAGLPRTAALRILGNGVVPQQAEHAVRLLLADLIELAFHADACHDQSEVRAA
jgi:DNA (cytosine-5)-methyltransferase 1